MKAIAVVLATVLLLAGCSGSSDDQAGPEPSATTPAGSSTPFDRDKLDKQAKEQADQAQAAQDQLAEKVDRASDEQRGTLVEIAIKDGKVTPQGKRVEVAAGHTVRLLVSSDVDEEIHVHSDPEHTYQVPAGGSIEKSFTLDTPGQVAVEAHELGVTIVQLVVRP